MRSRNAQRGFSLIELLVVVAILGLLASVLIPNLIDALQKARQKRALTDVRGIGTAWMAWLTDQVGAASAGAGNVYDKTGFAPITYSTLIGYLRPSEDFFYAQEIPKTDPWGTAYAFAMDDGGALTGEGNIRILVCAAGRDRTFTHCNQNQVEITPFIATDYDQDIVWADGSFLRWPVGLSDL
jgi:prepilin-type N-terminal cleavage/methylation domain-containing protein